MRRAISFILALVFCFSLALSVSATTNSPAQGGTPSTTTSNSGANVVGDNPKTGDNGHMELWVPMMVCSALALVAVEVVYSKKFAK